MAIVFRIAPNVMHVQAQWDKQNVLYVTVLVGTMAGIVYASEELKIAQIANLGLLIVIHVKDTE